jgi:hypothetical protein
MKNLEQLEEILLKLKCNFADGMYSKYIKELYSLKGCSTNEDIDQLRDYIFLLESKIKLLKYSLNKKCDLLPIRLNKNDISNFYENEKYLTKCDRKFLEKIL